MEPSCMRVGGGFDYGALTIAQAPILILGVKDNFGKIKGRSLLIPIKDENEKWRFELKNTYGAGIRLHVCRLRRNAFCWSPLLAY